MATKETSTLKTIEELAFNSGIDDAVFAGVCVSEQWSKGKRVSKSKFDTAVKNFLKAPLSEGAK